MPMPCRRGTQNRRTVGLVIYSRTDHTKPQRFSSAVFTQEKYMHKATQKITCMVRDALPVTAPNGHRSEVSRWEAQPAAVCPVGSEPA